MRSSKTLLFAFGGLATTASNASEPVTVMLDGAQFATRHADGWHHISGEMALPIQRERVGVLPDGPLSNLDVVTICEDGSCRFLLEGSGFEVRGSQIWRNDVHRGDVSGADQTAQRQVAVLLAMYRPPGPVTVVIHARREDRQVELSVSAMPSGELIYDLSCQWPERCDGVEQVVGNWTDQQISLNGTTVVLSDVVTPKNGGWRFESQHPRGAVELTATGQIEGPPGSSWRATERFGGSVVPSKRSVEIASPAAAAAFTGAVLELETWWLSERAAAPPPPPPPPM